MNERELQLFCNRLLDLSRQCEDRNVPTHSYFLTVEEQRLAAQCLPNVAGIRMISDGVFLWDESALHVSTLAGKGFFK